MVISRDVEYEAGGLRMRGRLALPDGDDRRPGVLIAHEANGLDDFQLTRPERLAELGYVAFALDYWGGRRVHTDRAEMFAAYDRLGADLDTLRARARAGLDVLAAEPRTDPDRLAAVGYCFGGTTVLELARSGADLKAVVGHHPGLAAGRPQNNAAITGSVLLCIGADDPHIPEEHRAAFERDMRGTGVDWRIELYGGVEHSFTHPRLADLDVDPPPGLRYDERADRRSWRAMLALFDEVL
jgi:dienelactone hydrolase